MTPRLASRADIPQILEFERVSRGFFEQFVPPRPEEYFTTPNAFLARMNDLLVEQAAGRYLMFVLQGANAEILGRLNLTIYEGPEATLGYRIGQKYTGHGLAALAIKMVEPGAVKKYKLTKLSAFAAPSNPASVKTLQNAGFTRDPTEMRMVTLNNNPLTLHKYQKECRAMA